MFVRTTKGFFNLDNATAIYRLHESRPDEWYISGDYETDHKVHPHDAAALLEYLKSNSLTGK